MLPPLPALQRRSPKFKNNYKNVPMAPIISLNAQNLEALGAMRLAELLIEISDGNAPEHSRPGWPDFEWEDARIDALEALNRGKDAQAARWSCFERFMSERHLWEYLKRLPDFDDVESGKTRARLRRELQEPATRAVFLGDLACIGSRGETRRGSSGRAERRSLRDLLLTPESQPALRADRALARLSRRRLRGGGSFRRDRIGG